MERCIKGDRQAFETLLIRYQRPVYNAAYRMLHSPDDARDVTQTVFLKVYEHLDQFDPAVVLLAVFQVVVKQQRWPAFQYQRMHCFRKRFAGGYATQGLEYAVSGMFAQGLLLRFFFTKRPDAAQRT